MILDIAKLQQRSGSAREIVNLPNSVIVWTDSDALATLTVLKSLLFDSFVITNAEVGINFVECSFQSCVFNKLRSCTHFWAAKDSWRECEFLDCAFQEMIAPINSFTACKFENVSIHGFRPHQTLFQRCLFKHLRVDGMKAHPISNDEIVNPDLVGARGQLVFRNCAFDSSSFRRCYFDGVVFERCSFTNTDAESCSFDGIVSDSEWWPQQKADPFTVFLTSALETIRSKCGADSFAYKEFESYVTDYGSGRTTSRDFSACLYNNRVPYADTQKVINDLRRLISTHPF